MTPLDARRLQSSVASSLEIVASITIRTPAQSVIKLDSMSLPNRLRDLNVVDLETFPTRWSNSRRCSSAMTVLTYWILG